MLTSNYQTDSVLICHKQPHFSSTPFDVEIMAVKILLTLIAALFITALYAAPNQGFRCRVGHDDSMGSTGYIYDTKHCGASEPACFQSVHCENIGVTQFKTNKWQCINPQKCERDKEGKLTAKYDGVHGICCLENMCNAYKMETCTDLKKIQ